MSDSLCLESFSVARKDAPPGTLHRIVGKLANSKKKGVWLVQKEVYDVVLQPMGVCMSTFKNHLSGVHKPSIHYADKGELRELAHVGVVARKSSIATLVGWGTVMSALKSLKVPRVTLDSLQQAKTER